MNYTVLTWNLEQAQGVSVPGLNVASFKVRKQDLLRWFRKL
jgi:hypothetical protein